MLTRCYCFIAIFFLLTAQPVFSQAGSDSTESVVQDSTRSGELTLDSLVQPLSDSVYRVLEPFREVPQKKLNSYLVNPDYAYANDPEYWKKQPPPQPGFFYRLLGNKVFRWLIFMVVIVILSFGIYMLAKESNFKWLLQKASRDKAQPIPDLPAEKMDYEKAIAGFENENNYRMAVRFMYLRLIHTASEKGIIVLSDSSTNTDITRTFDKRAQSDEFRFLASAYEYIFYGGFAPGSELYDVIKSRFDGFQKLIFV